MRLLHVPGRWGYCLHTRAFAFTVCMVPFACTPWPLLCKTCLYAVTATPGGVKLCSLGVFTDSSKSITRVGSWPTAYVVAICWAVRAPAAVAHHHACTCAHTVYFICSAFRITTELHGLLHRGYRTLACVAIRDGPYMLSLGTIMKSGGT
jgi:hypothetical protein